jgi:predicted aspartyl protease
VAGREPGARVAACWPYQRGIRLPYPVIRLRLYNAALEEYGEIPLQVDTGYEGPVMMPRGEYEFFQIGELPRSLWRSYRTLTDTVTMRTARAVAEVAGRRLEVYIESPLYGGGRRLVGREVLNQLCLLLDGPSLEACITGPPGQQRGAERGAQPSHE